MAKMGRPKKENPICRVVPVKFKETEYQIMLEYAQRHNLSISQLLRLGAELQIRNERNQ